LKNRREAIIEFLRIEIELTEKDFLFEYGQEIEKVADLKEV
jgi:hypothetical protein